MIDDAGPPLSAAPRMLTRVEYKLELVVLPVSDVDPDGNSGLLQERGFTS